MRHIGILSLAFLAALLPLACQSTSSPAVTSAKEKTGAAADAKAAAAKAKRDEYARAMQKQLEEFDAKCKALEQRDAEAKGDVKGLNEKVKAAKARRDAAAKKLDELKEAGPDRWEKVKDGVGHAFEDLKKVFE